MKTALILLLLVIGSVSLNATIITVDNKFPSAGKFTNLQDAHDYAIDGDTIYVYPSQVPYNAISVSKKLVIIGSGWESSGTGLDYTLMNGFIHFMAGSNGSKIIGFGDGGNYRIQLHDGVDNITIKRNELNKIHIGKGSTGVVINGNNIYAKWNSGVVYLLIIEEDCEVLISNNILFNFTSNSGDDNIIKASYSTIIIENNFFQKYSPRGDYAIFVESSNIFVTNNIFNNGWISGVDSKYYNNLSPKTQYLRSGFNGLYWADYKVLPEINDNQNGVDFNDVFVDYANSDFHLKPGSPAIGAGKNGTDMGIYGGSKPFVDGGYPGIPSIIEFEADDIGSRQDGLNVKIKAKSNKD